MIPTLAEWLEEWSASRRHHLEASSTHSYRVMADAYLLPHLGEVPLDELDVRTIEATYARLLTSGGRAGRSLARGPSPTPTRSSTAVSSTRSASACSSPTPPPPR